jgi:hypothetical protein
MHSGQLTLCGVVPNKLGVQIFMQWNHCYLERDLMMYDYIVYQKSYLFWMLWRSDAPSGVDRKQMIRHRAL